MHQPDPTFPPLLSGTGIKGQPFPFEHACAEAAGGKASAGDVFWGRSTSDVRVAIVLEPEVSAAQSLQMMLALMVAFADAFGSVGPPEVGVFYRWPASLVVNDALIGGMRAALPKEAAATDVPDWLVVGFDVRLSRTKHDVEPGHDLGNTTLEDEGCGDLTRTLLVESVCRHFLVWVHTWNEEGFKPVHDAWLPRAESHEQMVTVTHDGGDQTGQFLGIDEEGNMLLKPDAGDVRALSLLDHVVRV